MFPPKGVRQDLPEAFRSYKQFLESSSEPHSQFILGFFYATGLGGVERDQAKATLYYTFAALQGYKPAQMAMGYRYWAGIGVKGVSCLRGFTDYRIVSMRWTIMSPQPEMPTTLSMLVLRVGSLCCCRAAGCQTVTEASSDPMPLGHLLAPTASACP